MRQGFTLIELMIVIAIIAIIAAIAIPNLLESRVTANEAAASASLKSAVFAGQTQFQGGGYLDRDQDNQGEFGTIRMLAGLEATSRTSTGAIRLVTGPLANAASWSLAGIGTAAPAFGTASGFTFGSMVPSGTDPATEVTEELYYDGVIAATATVAASIADTTVQTANQGERGWCAAAIPQEWGNTGRRIFSIGNDGQIHSPANVTVQNEVYSGAAATLVNGQKPAASVPAALGRAIATALGTQAATNAAAVTLTMFDGSTYNGYPVFTK